MRYSRVRPQTRRTCTWHGVNRGRRPVWSRARADARRRCHAAPVRGRRAASLRAPRGIRRRHFATFRL